MQSLRTLPSVFFHAFAWAGALACVASFAQAQTETKTLAPGIVYRQELRGGAEPMAIHVLTLDLKAPGVKIRYGQARDVITLEGETKGRETLSAMVARKGALAAINGDFAAYTGDPLGVAIRDGELISEPMESRVAMGVNADGVKFGLLTSVGALVAPSGAAIPLTGINRVPHGGDIVVWTPTYQGKVVAEKPSVVITLKEVNLPLKPSHTMTGRVDTVAPYMAGEVLPPCPPDGVQIIGVGEVSKNLVGPFNQKDRATFRFDLVEMAPTGRKGPLASRSRSPRPVAPMPAWQDMEQVLGGGPWLVKNGIVSLDWEEEGFDLMDFVEKRHPRTAIGTTEGGKLLLVAVDGRQGFSKGMSLRQLAELMRNLGATNAINLDGGGSTTMVIGGATVNSPSDGKLRALANGLLVFGEAPEIPEAAGFRISPGAETGLAMKPGETQTFRILDADGMPIRADIPVVWGTEEGKFFITQQGFFTPNRVGTVTILAFVGGKTLRLPVTIAL